MREKFYTVAMSIVLGIGMAVATIFTTILFIPTFLISVLYGGCTIKEIFYYYWVEGWAGSLEPAFNLMLNGFRES